MSMAEWAAVSWQDNWLGSAGKHVAVTVRVSYILEQVQMTRKSGKPTLPSPLSAVEKDLKLVYNVKVQA
jgi:hypothetical protein